MRLRIGAVPPDLRSDDRPQLSLPRLPASDRGAFAVNALIETDRIEVLSGKITAISIPTDIGRPHDIHRSPICATALWSDYGRRPAMRFVRATILDDPKVLSPDVHSFTRLRLPWVGLLANVPAFEIHCDMATLWPADSLARRKAILGDG